jgi:L-ascorbate metabolism protein UlaG (beta-lactamase superfamily)
MTITLIGHACFKIIGRDATIVTDPFEKKIGLTPPRMAADIVTISHEHFDHNNRSTVSGEPFIIDSPGEYDVKGVAIRGIPSFHDRKEGAERGTNTLYHITIDGVRIAHLGDLGQAHLSDEQLDALDEVDVLCIPVGGVYTIDAEDATKITSQIEPKIVIPMHYAIPSLSVKLEKVDTFLKEMGVKAEPVEKLSLKAKELPPDGTQVVVLIPQRN